MSTRDADHAGGAARRLLRVVGGLLLAASLGASVLTVAGFALLQVRGDQVMVVASGSMAPTFRAGDVLLVRPVGRLEPGRVVTFHEVGRPEQLTTHRIVARDERPEGLFLQTRGDANPAPDPNLVPADAVVGEMHRVVPLLGRWLALLQSAPGRLGLFGLPLLLLVVGQAAATLRELRGRPRQRRGLLAPAPVFGVTAVVLVSVAAGVALGQRTGATFGDRSLVATTVSTSTFCGGGTTYAQAVAADLPVLHHRFSEASGPTLHNSAGGAAGTATGGYRLGVDGATACEGTSTALRLDGSTGQVVSSAVLPSTAPAAFSLELWFRTTRGGGRLLGFGSDRTGLSVVRDRQLWLTDAGHLVFGVAPTLVGPRELRTPESYLDGRWHHVVATLGSGGATTGMRLYVDGTLAAYRTDVTTAELNLLGWWRIGHDSLAGWPLAPSRDWYAGDLDEVAVFHTPLTAARVSAHYAERRG